MPTLFISVGQHRWIVRTTLGITDPLHWWTGLLACLGTFNLTIYPPTLRTLCWIDSSLFIAYELQPELMRSGVGTFSIYITFLCLLDYLFVLQLPPASCGWDPCALLHSILPEDY